MCANSFFLMQAYQEVANYSEDELRDFLQCISGVKNESPVGKKTSSLAQVSIVSSICFCVSNNVFSMNLISVTLLVIYLYNISSIAVLQSMSFCIHVRLQYL